MNVKLSEKAQQEQALFEIIFLPRSKQKWNQGVRTQKRLTPQKEWEWYVQHYGPNLLVSCYNSHRYCVITKPDEQLGMLTEELPDWIQAALTQGPRKPFAVSLSAGKETEEPYQPVVTMTEHDLAGLKGECWGDENGQIGLSVPPLGIHPDAIQWKIVDVTAASGRTPAWADVVAGKRRIRINPDICQPPFWRLADCVWFTCGLWESLPTGSEWARIALPPKPHPHSQEFVFQRCTLPGGVEVVLIDTFDRCEEFCHQPAIKDGQHRTRIK